MTGPEVPLLNASQPRGAAARAPAAVLLVDDRPSELLALQAALGRPAFEVLTARSGMEALGLALQRDLAAIVLDVRMPEMDGFETARHLRARTATQHVPILFLTAFDIRDEEVARAYDLGAVDLVQKPVKPEIFRSKVQVFVELYERSREARRT